MKASAGNRVLMLLENSIYPIDPRVRQGAKTLTGAGYQVLASCPRAVNQPWRENLDGVFIECNGLDLSRLQPLGECGWLCTRCPGNSVGERRHDSAC